MGGRTERRTLEKGSWGCRGMRQWWIVLVDGDTVTWGWAGRGAGCCKAAPGSRLMWKSSGGAPGCCVGG